MFGDEDLWGFEAEANDPNSLSFSYYGSIVEHADRHENFEHLQFPDGEVLDPDELYRRDVEHFWPGGVENHEYLAPEPESPPRFEADDDDPFYTPMQLAENTQPDSVTSPRSMDYLPSSPPEFPHDQADLESSPLVALDMAAFEEFLRTRPELAPPEFPEMPQFSPPDVIMGGFMSERGSSAGSPDDAHNRNQNLPPSSSPLRAQLPSVLPNSSKVDTVMKDSVGQQNLTALDAQKPGGMPAPVPRVVFQKINIPGLEPYYMAYDAVLPPGYGQSFDSLQKLEVQHQLAMHHSQMNNANVNNLQMAAPASQSGYPAASQSSNPAAAHSDIPLIPAASSFAKAGVNKTGRNTAKNNAADRGSLTIAGSSPNAQQHNQPGLLPQQAANKKGLGLKDSSTPVQQQTSKANTTATASSTPPAKSTSSKKQAEPTAAPPTPVPQSSPNSFVVDFPADAAAPPKAVPPKVANTSVQLPLIAVPPQDLKKAARARLKQQAIENAQAAGGKDHTLIPVVQIPAMSGVKPPLGSSQNSMSGGKPPLEKSQTLSGGSFKAVMKNLNLEKDKDDGEDDDSDGEFTPVSRSSKKGSQGGKKQAEDEEDSDEQSTTATNRKEGIKTKNTTDETPVRKGKGNTKTNDAEVTNDQNFETPAQKPKRSHKKMSEEAKLAAKAQRDAAKALEKQKKENEETPARRSGRRIAGKEQEAEVAESDSGGRMATRSGAKKGKGGGEQEDKGGNKKRKRESAGKGK